MKESNRIETNRVRYKVKALAQKFGATIEIEKDSNYDEIFVTAPKGFHWRVDVHQLVASQNRGFGVIHLWKDLLDRMEFGIEECTEDTCQLWNKDDGCEFWDDDPIYTYRCWFYDGSCRMVNAKTEEEARAEAIKLSCSPDRGVVTTIDKLER